MGPTNPTTKPMKPAITAPANAYATARPHPLELCSVAATCGPRRNFSLQPSLCFHHRVPFRLELDASFPFGKFGGVGDLAADFEKKIDILHRAGEVPIGFYFVSDLVVIAQIEFIGAEWRVGRPRKQMLAVSNV